MINSVLRERFEIAALLDVRYETWVWRAINEVRHEI